MEWTDGKFRFKGDPSELTRLLENKNIDSSAFFPDKRKKSNLIGLFVCATLYLLTSCSIWLFYTELSSYIGVVYILLIALIACTAIFMHTYFREWAITLISIFFCVIIMLVSMHVMTPSEASKEIKKRTDIAIDSKTNSSKYENEN